MIWVWLAVVAAAGLAPLFWSARNGGQTRGRRDAALLLHRAQLAELDRDLAQGRLLDSEHAAAKLEVQRRLLAEAEQVERAHSRSGPFGLALIGVAVPAAAVLMYVAAGGVPDYAHRRNAAEQAGSAPTAARDQAAVVQLRETLAKMDGHTETARRGYVMLGRAELSLGHLPEAADAWRRALAQRFEPELGAETAEVISEEQSRVTPEAADLFRRALAEAPADAPWRKDAEKRISEAVAF